MNEFAAEPNQVFWRAQGLLGRRGEWSMVYEEKDDFQRLGVLKADGAEYLAWVINTKIFIKKLVAHGESSWD